MNWLIVVLSVLLLALQYRLWIGEGSLAEIDRLDRKILAQSAENERLLAGNDRLSAKVRELKEGHVGLESRARASLGMVKKGETYFMFVEE